MSEILDKLNRYSITLSFEDDGTPWPTAKIDGNGEYVRYDQAAPMLAAKDEVQKQWQDISKHYTGYENPSMGFRVLIERAEAAEAELAQSKKENIEKLSDLISRKMIKSAEEISETWGNNLIYGNNEDDDSNSGLSSVLSGKEQP